MAPTTAQPRTPVRQWRITVTEDPSSALYRAHLEWRTFPARHDHWDGRLWSQYLALGPRIAKPDDLEAVLAMFVECDWTADTLQHLRTLPREPTCRQGGAEPPGAP